MGWWWALALPTAAVLTWLLWPAPPRQTPVIARSNPADAGVAVPDAAPPAAAPAGDQALSGRILGVDGSGLVGVTVRLIAPGGGEALTQSGEDGVYAFRGLARGLYRLRAEGAGVVPSEVARVSVPGKNVAVVVARRVRLAGVVLDGGVAAKGARVELSSSALAEPRTVEVDGEGRFVADDLPEGRYRVAARRGTFAGQLSVARFGAGPWEPVVVVLAPAAVVSGEVRAQGAGVAGAWIVLAPAEAELGVRRARTDGAGRFTLEGVLVGTWSLDAEAEGLLLDKRLPVEAVAGERVDLVVDMQVGGVVAGEVVDADGRAVAGAEVGLLDDRGAIVWSAAQRARRRAWLRGEVQAGNGKLIPVGELGVVVGPVPYPPPPGAKPIGAAGTEEASAVARTFATDGGGRFALTGVPAGRFGVRVRHPDFAETTSGPVTLPGAEAVRVVLRRGATITGVVVGEGGAPRMGVQVVVETGGHQSTVTFSDEAGRFRVPHVLGDVLLRAVPRGEAPASRALAISAADEGRTIDVTLALAGGPAPAAEVGSVELDVRDASTYGPILSFRARLEGPGGEVERAGERGELRIGNLRAGAWRVAIRAPGFAHREVDLEVTAGRATPVRVELVQGATVGGVVYDTHGDAVAGAEVSSGGVRATTTATGAFRLTGVPPGDVAVVASHPRRGRGEARIPLRGGDEVSTLEIRIGP